MNKFPLVPACGGPPPDFWIVSVNAILPNGSANPRSVAGGASFSRSSRLLRHADFERVYKQGRRYFASHMTVFYLRRGDAGSLRIGFTVGRGLGGAVERNRMKRRLREAVRLRGTRAEVAVDVVINPKKSLLTAEFADLQKDISRAFDVIEKSAGKG